MTIRKQTRVKLLIILNSLMFLGELFFGYYTRSISLVTDSFHMLSDIMALCIALYAINIAANRKPIKIHTFGWQRAEPLGALVNATFLLALCFTIVVSAIQRFVEPVQVRNPLIVLFVGCVGLLVNLIGLVLFHDHGDSPHNGSKLNMRAVFLHVLGDALGSVGVIISAIVIKWSGWEQSYYIDPIMSILIAGIIIITTIPLLRKTLGILLHVVPEDIQIENLHAEILKVDQIEDLHEFHIWQLSDNKTIASIHLLLAGNIDVHDYMGIVTRVKDILHNHGIHSTTVQLETPHTIDISDRGEDDVEGCMIKCLNVCKPQTCCET